MADNNAIDPESSRREVTSSYSLGRETTNPEYGDLGPPSDNEQKTEKSGRQGPASATGNSLGLERTVTRRETVLSRIRSRPVIGNFNHPLEHKKTAPSQLVDFEGPDDPYRPLNWNMKKKIVTTALYGFTTMSATWGSSSYSAGTKQVSEEFHVGTQVATLGTTLFLFGFGLGPLLWAPLSEVYGRKNAVLPPMFVASCFAFATAVSKDIQSVMITRFWAGFFASAPVTNTGGVISDLFPSTQRGIAMASYAVAVVLGPVFGPIISAALVVQPDLSWRWTEYFTGILQLFVLVFGVTFLDESYPPRLLVYKARRLRHQSGNWALHAKFEEWDVSIKELASKFLVRPFQLLMTPICALMALYASFCYGILYMQLGQLIRTSPSRPSPADTGNRCDPDHIRRTPWLEPGCLGTPLLGYPCRDPHWRRYQRLQSIPVQQNSGEIRKERRSRSSFTTHGIWFRRLHCWNVHHWMDGRSEVGYS